jgi:hypothetical protein
MGSVLRLRLNAPDCRSVHFRRTSRSSPFGEVLDRVILRAAIAASTRAASLTSAFPQTFRRLLNVRTCARTIMGTQKCVFVRACVESFAIAIAQGRFLMLLGVAVRRLA